MILWGGGAQSIYTRDISKLKNIYMRDFLCGGHLGGHWEFVGGGGGICPQAPHPPPPPPPPPVATPLLHTSLVAMAAVRHCGSELVDHPPYSPDLAPSDYFLFPNMKKTLGWEALSDWSYLQLRTFSRIMMRASIPQESKRCKTNGRSVWTTGKTM